MITAADLAPIKIDSAIFHDVPNRPRKFEGNPRLSTLVAVTKAIGLRLTVEAAQ